MSGTVKGFRTEHEILRRSANPFIMHMHYSFMTEDYLYLVMDFVNGGELFSHLNKCGGFFDEERARFYAAEMILALEYLHQNGVMVRDVKPENILLDAKGHIVVTDFGVSKGNRK